MSERGQGFGNVPKAIRLVNGRAGEEKTSWLSPEGGAGTRLELGPQPGEDNA